MKIGDTLYCKYRGKVQISKTLEDGFYISKNNVEYFQKYSDIGKVLFKEDILNGGRTKKEHLYIPLRYEQCLDNKVFLTKDEILKEEAKYLCRTRNIIGSEIFDLRKRIDIMKENMGWGRRVDIEERESWIFDRMQMEKRARKIEELHSLDLEPYFARLDIEATLDKEIIKVYIGQKSISDNGNNVVYDWRSPLGQRYYRRNELNFNLGNKEYTTNLIRRFEIKKSILYSYENEYCKNDSYEDFPLENNINTISDPFLIKILMNKRNKENIGNIISSIQNNQNNIITHDINKNIIVQGCAGSGKTMVLLHRLSYLLFNNRNLDLERIKIITPNNLFKGSINNLAKELELDKIEMMSVEEYFGNMIKVYGMSISYEYGKQDTPDDIYNYIYSSEFNNLLEKSYIEYVESLWKKYKSFEINKLKTLYNVDQYIDEREKVQKFTYLRRVTEVINRELDNKINEYENLKEELKDEEKLKIKNLNEKIRLEEDSILKLENLQQLIKKEKNLSWLAVFERRNIKIQINDLLREIGLEEKDIVSLGNFIEYKEKNIKIYKGKLSYKDDINKHEELVEFREHNFLGYEPNELKNRLNVLNSLLGKGNNRFLETKIYRPLILNISKQFNYDEDVVSGRIKLYSLLRLLYIHKGKIDKVDRMLCFDEGQDVNKFEYELINTINGNNVIYNILGDINQLISSNRGINDWSVLYEIKEFDKFELEENYRNSQEIAKHCINETSYRMNPIGVDDGNVIVAENEDWGYIGLTRTFMRDNGKRKVILVKQISDDVKKFLSLYFEFNSINIVYDDSKSLDNNKINVMTVKMAKGMEFDTTLVITKYMTRNEKYIALTRALVNSYIIN